MQKYLNNKKLWLLTLIIFLLSLLCIILIANIDKEIVPLDMELINEKDVSFIKVFSQNLLLVSKSIIYGLVTIGMYSLYTVFQNIVAVGLISNSLIQNGYERMAVKLIPHGVIEFLGIALSLAIVIYIWIKILKLLPQYIKREVKLKSIIKEIVSTLVMVFCIEIVLFLTAGVVEVIVSGYKVL